MPIYMRISRFNFGGQVRVDAFPLIIQEQSLTHLQSAAVHIHCELSSLDFLTHLGSVHEVIPRQSHPFHCGGFRHSILTPTDR